MTTKKVNGGKVEYATGAVRTADAEGTRYTLITPIGLRRLAETYAEGSAKYGDHNWLKGMPVEDCLEHALRHIYIYLSGDRGEDHLAHAAWNLMTACHSEESWPELNGNLRRPNCTPPAILNVIPGLKNCQGAAPEDDAAVESTNTLVRRGGTIRTTSKRKKPKSNRRSV